MNMLTTKSPTVKALSIAGCFPWLLAAGKKQIELRSWGTSYQGIVLLHASSGTGYEHLFPQMGLSRKTCPKFALVGAAKLKTCIQYNSQKLWDAHKPRHLWDEDFDVVVEQYGKFPFGHIMEDAITFKDPILDVPGAFNYWQPKNEKQQLGFEKAIALLSAIGYC